MRFGLVGTGPWARIAQGPGLVAAPDAELVGVWGRSPEKAAVLAAELGPEHDIAAYDDFEALLDDVEAVAFCVPPDVQVALAGVAARAGKHLLLDKPMGTDPAAARALAEEVRTAGVASLVLFTDRFAPAYRAWLEQVRASGGWLGAWTLWLTALDAPDNPFRDSPWRWERGALWDIGPHVLSTLDATLGPVTHLRALPGQGDAVTLVLRHESGATSSATLSLFTPPAAITHDTTLWGPAGLSTMPGRTKGQETECVAVAVGELVACARSGRTHELDATFGARVTELLADAQAQLEAALEA